MNCRKEDRVCGNTIERSQPDLNKIKMGSFYGKLSKNELKYIGNDIDEVIEDEECKLGAEDAINASLDDAVEELETNYKEEKEIDQILNDVEINKSSIKEDYKKRQTIRRSRYARRANK